MFSVLQNWILCLWINSTTISQTHTHTLPDTIAVLLVHVLRGAGVSMWRGNYLLDQSEPLLSLKDKLACSHSTNQPSDRTAETSKARVCMCVGSKGYDWNKSAPLYFLLKAWTRHSGYNLKPRVGKSWCVFACEPMEQWLLHHCSCRLSPQGITATVPTIIHTNTHTRSPVCHSIL